MRKDPAQLCLRHDVDGLLQAWGSAIVKIRGGHRHIPEAWYTEDMSILVIAGNSKASRVSFGDRTFFIGRCQDVGAVLSISDVCVLSSTSEGFSNAILEYMAAGRPVVATDVGGAREAIVHGESGYLVSAGDDDAMADRIKSLLLQPELARAMGEYGKRIVTEKFSSQKQLQNVESLYSEMLNGVSKREKEIAVT